MTDRKKLEAALTQVRRHTGGWVPEFVTVLEAAEAHLASLPKPMWTVRVSFPGAGDGNRIREWFTQHDALTDASSFLTLGACKVEIEAP